MKKVDIRWKIATLLLFATFLNHLDRNVMAMAAPTLKQKIGLDEMMFAWCYVAFMFAYTIGQLSTGRIIDYLKTRAGFALAVAWWSVANILHIFGVGVKSFAVFRFLLGVGESGLYPAGVKTIAEWFPARERTVAFGLFNIGAGIGGAVAMILTGYLIGEQGRWQLPFALTGLIGAVWVYAWWRYYRSPEEHPKLSKRELEYIHEGQKELQGVDTGDQRRVWGIVLRDRNVWAISVTRFFTEMPWSFFTIWVPTYFAFKFGMGPKQIGWFAWVPFIAAILGSLAGGYLSPLVRKMGFSLLTARKIAFTIPCLMMPSLLFVFNSTSIYVATAIFCIGYFAHQALSATLLTLPADLLPKHTVATANGLTGSIGFSGVIFFTIYVGIYAKNADYAHLFTVMAFVDILAVAIIWLFVHKPKAAIFKTVNGE